MSIIINTVYPCDNCKEEISPMLNFCPNCGQKQPDRSEANIYNLFYRKQGTEAFNMLYGGDIILEFADIEEEAMSKITSVNYEYFIGSYITSEQDPDSETLKVRLWQPVTRSGIGPDQGEQTIQITSLE